MKFFYKRLKNWHTFRKVNEEKRHDSNKYLWRIHFDIWQNKYNFVKFKNKIK